MDQESPKVTVNGQLRVCFQNLLWRSGSRTEDHVTQLVRLISGDCMCPYAVRCISPDGNNLGLCLVLNALEVLN